MKIETDRETRRQSAKPELKRSRSDRRGEREMNLGSSEGFVTNHICGNWEITVFIEVFFCSGKRK